MLDVCLFAYLPARLPDRPSVRPPVRPRIRLSCLSVCMSVPISVSVCEGYPAMDGDGNSLLKKPRSSSRTKRLRRRTCWPTSRRRLPAPGETLTAPKPWTPCRYGPSYYCKLRKYTYFSCRSDSKQMGPQRIVLF